MFNGLSLEQAPPISVVLRFFLTLPLFGLALSVLMIFSPQEILTLTHPLSLAAIHLFFLGVISMGMIGALFQMQSVLGGQPIAAPLGNSLLIHTLFTGGVLSLFGAFALGISELFVIAGVLLGSALLYFAMILLPLLFGTLSHDTLKGMRFSIMALLATATLGIIMATSYASGTFGEHHTLMRTAHYSIGLVGWIGALIIYVAFQVVEMFYVTSPYSDWCKQNAKRILASALLLKILWLFLALPFVWVFDAVIGLLLAGFIVTTAKRLRQRKRRVSDASIWFWFAGLGLLTFAIGAYTASRAFDYLSLEMMSLIAFGLFALAILLGMMGKIVPFLVWFHLNASGFLETPIMSTILPQKRLKITFLLFLSTALFALAAALSPWVLTLAGLSAFAMFGVILFNLIAAARLYRHVLNTGTKFSFDA
ncbi:MAG TPA: hypothetical protein VFX68_09970 [Sulfuricurvum sp.]|nr:hypothetical protein [Sulfuricurvum sp.]